MFNSKSGRFNPFSRQNGDGNNTPANAPGQPNKQQPMFGQNHPSRPQQNDPRLGQMPQNRGQFMAPQHPQNHQAQGGMGGMNPQQHGMNPQFGPNPMGPTPMGPQSPHHAPQNMNPFYAGQGPSQQGMQQNGHQNPQNFGPQSQGRQHSQPQGQAPLSSSKAVTGPMHTDDDYYEDMHSQQFDQNGQQHRSPIGTRDDFPQMKSGAPQNQEDLRGLSFWREDEEETPYQDDPESSADRASPLKFIFAVTGLVLMTGVSWLVYRWATQPSNNMLPLIPAEQGPYKVRPENPGGMLIPHQDKLIYGRLTPQIEQENERLLPQQDRNYYQNPPQQYQGYPQHNQGQMQGQGQNQAYSQNYQNQAQQGRAPQNQMQNQGQNQPYAPQQSAPQQNFMTPEQQAYQQKLQLQQRQLEEQQRQQKAQADMIARQKADLQKAQEKIMADQKKTAAQTVEAKPLTTTATQSPKKLKTQTNKKPPAGFYVQLGSLPNENSAKSEWLRLRKKNPKDLGSHIAYIRKSEGTARKVYRVLVGPFTSRNAALKKCVRVGGGCKVIQVSS